MLRSICWIVVLISWALVGRAQEVSVATESPPIGPLPMERLASRIEPDLAGRPERLEQYVNFFRRELVSDSRLIAFDVVAKAGDDGRAELTGYVEFPETRQSLVRFLEALKFNVDDQLETLPSESLGERRFGIVKTPHSLSYDRPRGRRAAVTDYLVGEPLYLLREDSGHFLVHGGEGYLGYVSADDVLRVDGAQFTKYLEGPRVRVTSDVELAKDRMLPAGARLKLVSAADDEVTAELPTGEEVSVPAKSCEVCREPVEEIDAIVENAKRLIGTRYFWGGKTSQGVDCSGLVQVGFATVGLNLPRDAYQQFYLGRLTATRWHRDGMRRGDTLYFVGSDGRIRHTALYLGDDLFLQAVVPRVTISSFNAGHENYDAGHVRSFAFAKRLVE
jgi:gamma-D-glutamyl-L-lysine dipeptidyl-peptidase